MITDESLLSFLCRLSGRSLLQKISIQEILAENEGHKIKNLSLISCKRCAKTPSGSGCRISMGDAERSFECKRVIPCSKWAEVDPLPFETPFAPTCFLYEGPF